MGTHTHTQTLRTTSEIYNSQDAWLIFIIYPGTIKSPVLLGKSIHQEIYCLRIKHVAIS